jgi:hypothetical protein
MDTRKAVLALNVLFLIAFSATADQISPSTRSIVPRADRVSPPLAWIPADAAFTQTGELRADLFSEADQFILNDIRKRNPTQCTVFLGPPPSDLFLRQDSLDALVSSSRSIVRGRLLQRETGFHNGEPGSLFTLRPEAVLKSYGRIAADGTLFLFVPEATIRTSKGLICARTFSEIPTPVVGDEVLLFVTFDPIDAEQRILKVDTQKELVVIHDGHVFSPAATHALSNGVPKPYSTLDDLEWAIIQNTHVQDFPQGPQR